jgi:hypothetical protein
MGVVRIQACAGCSYVLNLFMCCLRSLATLGAMTAWQ